MRKSGRFKGIHYVGLSEIEGDILIASMCDCHWSVCLSLRRSVCARWSFVSCVGVRSAAAVECREDWCAPAAPVQLPRVARLGWRDGRVW